jgi:autoinducer 2-degrading protein
MTFRPEEIQAFTALFEGSKEKIRHFKGCTLLELYCDSATPTVFFTYSRWQSEGALEAYRQSDLFKSVWSQTKSLFASKPEAWSLRTVASVV